MKLLGALLLAVLVAGCGGGGGGAAFRITGRVVWLPTASAPSPPATVQIGSATTNTSAADGTFTLGISNGTEAIVTYVPPGGSAVAFTFELPPLSPTTELGDLWIGPSKVHVRGRVLSATDNAAIADARVQFAGKRATSDSTGAFMLQNVAYSAADLGVFFGIEGRIERSGFFTRVFFANNDAIGDFVDLGDILLSPVSEVEPPPPPSNVLGLVSPLAQAPGTEATLFAGQVAVRRFTVGSNGFYYFWVPPGSYTIRFHNPSNGLSAPDESVDLASSTDVVRRDVTLR